MPVCISTLPMRDADDGELVTAIADLVNEVYATAEKGFWADGAARTTTSEVGGFIRNHELAVAYSGRRPIGCVRVQRIAAAVSDFGMLAVPRSHRSRGVGRELVDFAERTSVAAGRPTMQAKILMPRGWTHPSKELLVEWYSRIGYRVVGVGRIDEAHPQLGPRLAAECDFVVYQKDLRHDQGQSRRSGRAAVRNE